MVYRIVYIIGEDFQPRIWQAMFLPHQILIHSKKETDVPFILKEYPSPYYLDQEHLLTDIMQLFLT